VTNTIWYFLAMGALASCLPLALAWVETGFAKPSAMALPTATAAGPVFGTASPVAPAPETAEIAGAAILA